MFPWLGLNAHDGAGEAHRYGLESHSAPDQETRTAQARGR